MAIKYIYGNDGSKHKYLADQEPQLYSGPYRVIEQQSGGASANKNGTAKAAKTAAKTTAAPAAAATVYNTQSEAEKKKKEKEKLIKAQRNREKQRLKQLYETEVQTAKDASEDTLRSLYIAYMQNKKALPQQAAMWGAGGDIDRLDRKNTDTYKASRNKTETELQDLLSKLQSEYEYDLDTLENKYLKQLLNL